MTGRAPLLLRRRARRLSEAVRDAMPRPPLAGDAGAGIQTRVVGLDPVRVLLFGSGPLIGYGVTERSDAVDGSLAATIAARTGRGVIVESRVRLGLPVEEAVRSLGGSGTATFQVAVWAPRFVEELHASKVEQRAAALRSMLQDYRSASSVPLVLCHLPVPEGNDWRTLLRRPRVSALNGAMTEIAAGVPGVTVAEPPAYTPPDLTSTGASWHRAFGERLAIAVLQAAGIRERSSADR